MRHYEIVFLVHPDQSEQVPAMVERYRSMITNEPQPAYRQPLVSATRSSRHHRGAIAPLAVNHLALNEPIADRTSGHVPCVPRRVDFLVWFRVRLVRFRGERHVCSEDPGNSRTG